MIPFNVPPCGENAIEYIRQAIESNKICGDGEFTKKCSSWIEKDTGTTKALLTTSGTHALEMAAFLCDIKPGDEVILPSYTFSSTANAFVNVGAKLVFVDINPKTMNIDEDMILKAINSKTKVIVVVHYAGVSCDMKKVMNIARENNIKVVEDAAQGVMSRYEGKSLGTFGDFGCFSFHETKNYSMGEGGALLIRDEKYIEKAEILREKGTDRSKFYRGQIDKYSWRNFGSSYLPSELNAAYLWAQLECAEEINNNRIDTWNTYYEKLKVLEERGNIELQHISEKCTHNAHMFWIKTENLEVRTKLLEKLKQEKILAAFHYVPLHSSDAGKMFGYFFGEDKYTTKESNRLIRLPMYYDIDREYVEKVVDVIKKFYENE